MTGTERAPTAGWPSHDLRVVYRASAPLAATMAFAVEVALVVAVFAGQIGLGTAALGHGLVVAALVLAMLVSGRRGRDAGPYLLLVPAVACTGPAGALGGVLIGHLSRRGHEDIARLDDWYRRLALSTELDPTARLADHVLTGRAIDVARATPPSITDLIVHGTIAEKQTILGVIARRFHPDYLPGLQTALIAEEPLIRVQAAAVAARIRGELPAYVERLLREASDASLDSDRLIALIDQAQRCVGSGLLETKDKERAERRIVGLRARTMVRLERRGAGAIRPLGHAAEAFERYLLETGRMAEFRRVRKMRLWARRGPWQWRPRPAVKRRVTGS